MSKGGFLSNLDAVREIKSSNMQISNETQFETQIHNEQKQNPSLNWFTFSFNASLMVLDDPHVHFIHVDEWQSNDTMLTSMNCMTITQRLYQ